MKQVTASIVRQAAALLLFLVLCLSAGFIGSWFTASSVDDWYQHLNKPNWNPPSWIFAPVWTTLYCMMAVAAWLVWRRAGLQGSIVAQICFGVQLILNTMWSIIFFGFQAPGWAFAEILVLWLAIAITVWQFRRFSTVAALLMIPYLGWTTFASTLNYTIWQLNK